MNPSSQTPVIALAGNPNVGKSTVFNALTGAHQHTGNWAGKTVVNAHGSMRCGGERLTLVDLPGTYSLRARSEEERAARDFLVSGEPDCTVLVADATCLERNLILVLQVLEVTQNVILCLNLMDEARKKGIQIDVHALRNELGIPVVPCAARRGQGLPQLQRAVCRALSEGAPETVANIRYPRLLEQAAAETGLPRGKAFEHLLEAPPEGMTATEVDDMLTASAALRAEEIAMTCVRITPAAYERDRRIDRVLLSRRFGVPLMLLLLAIVFYITLFGANVPSAWLGDHLLALTEPIAGALASIGLPPFIVSLLADGAWRVLATVVSVMLPPMAIFFPLFTLLEDAGYLPRVAFQLDHAFRRAHACGKQSLSMCMGRMSLQNCFRHKQGCQRNKRVSSLMLFRQSVGAVQRLAYLLRAAHKIQNNICRLRAELAGIDTHIIVGSLAPKLSGVVVVVGSALFIHLHDILRFLLGGLIIQRGVFVDMAQAARHAGGNEQAVGMRMVLQDKIRAAPNDHAGAGLCKLPDHVGFLQKQLGIDIPIGGTKRKGRAGQVAGAQAVVRQPRTVPFCQEGFLPSLFRNAIPAIKGDPQGLRYFFSDTKPTASVFTADGDHKI